jgi:helix-turn-helix protein
MGSWEDQISAVAALDDPTRRRLYDYVVRQPGPVSRDDAASALELPRTTAAFHLNRLLLADRVVAGMNVNVWEVTDAIQALIRSREPINTARLRDTDVTLEDLAARPVLRDPARSHSQSSPKSCSRSLVANNPRATGTRSLFPA